MLSPFAPQGSRATTAKKTQQEVSNRPNYLPCRYPGQARCSSSFLFSPSCSLLVQPPPPPPPPRPPTSDSVFLCLFFPLIPSFFLPPSPTFSSSPLSGRLCHWVSRSAESWRWLCKSAPYVLWFVGLQQSALTSGPITGLKACQSSPHISLQLHLQPTWFYCYQMFYVCVSSQNGHCVSKEKIMKRN